MLRGLSLLALFMAFPVAAQSPLPRSLPVDGPRSQVLNLGTVHLGEKKGWNAKMLDGLLDKLAAFRPEIITIEGVSGEQCEAMRQSPDLYADAYNGYCWNPTEVIASTRMSVPEANRKVRETLAYWPANPTPAQRRALAAAFIAAGERASATVQWLRLPKSERHSGDGLDEKLIEIMERKGKPMNESYDVAAVLAARLGLDRVVAVDDHTSDGIYAYVDKDFETALGKHFADARKNPLFAQYETDMSGITDSDSLLAYYRKMNTAGAMTPQVSADFGGAMAQQTPQHYGRFYLGWWETRNLRMAANIREALATRPGARMLNIVGSSHKPWYDALMGMMADVDIVDASAVLR